MSPLTIAGVIIAVLLGIVGLEYWHIGNLTKELVAANVAKESALAANKEWETQATRINGKVEDLISREAQSSREITQALLRVTASATRLIQSAQEVASRPLPADPSQDCTVTEAELRAFLRSRRAP